MTKLLPLALLASAPLCAQGLAHPGQTHFGFANGAALEYQAWDGRAPQLSEAYLLLPDGLRRRIRDGQRRPMLAFDVHVDPVGKSALRLSFTPVDGWPFFAQAPAPRDLQPGDHVLVDVLEQAGTGKKVYDSLSVGFPDTPMRLAPMPPDPLSVIAAGARLRLEQALLKENGVAAAKNSAAETGTRLRMALPNGGQYTLSSQPGPGYRLEAMVYGGAGRTAAVFSDGDILYGVNCRAPIVDQPGSWLLWVRKDASPTTPPKSVVPPGFPADQYNAILGVLGMPKAESVPSPNLPELKIWEVR
jgi:hypothetical protein